MKKCAQKSSLHKKNLWKIFLIFCAIFYGVSILGPYDWTIYSVEGLLYFTLVNALFFLGLLSIIPSRNRGSLAGITTKIPFDITSTQRHILVLISIISYALAIYEILMLVSYYGDAFEFLNGQYLERDAARNAFDKIAVVLMQFGTASYLILKLSGCRLKKSEQIHIFLGLFACGVYYLFVGNRFTIAVEFIIFVVVWCMTNNKKDVGLSGNRLSGATKVFLIAALLVLLVVAFMMIFANRPHTMIIEKYEMMPGDQSLKTMFVDLYSTNPNLWDPFFMLADYMGEAPFVFSGEWVFYFPDQIYWFCNTLRPLVQIASLFGLPSYSQIIEAIGGPSKYSGLAYALVSDFGVYLAPFAAFVIGHIFALIEHKRTISALARVLYPCTVACCIFAPIYYINVGRIDFVMFAVLLIFFMFGPFKIQGQKKQSQRFHWRCKKME